LHIKIEEYIYMKMGEDILLLALPACSTMNSITLETKTYIHSRLVRIACLRLWYVLRAIDEAGSGWAVVSFTQVRLLLRCASSTLYQWLRECKQIGAIRTYARKGDALTVWLGSRNVICHNLGLNDWGTTELVELREIINLSNARAQASIATVAKGQQASRHAALYKLTPEERRKQKELPLPEEIFKRQEGCLLNTGRWGTSISYVLKVTSGKVFVSKGFLPFGYSQKSVANSLGMSDRTVRRHLDLLDVDRRQILQTKTGYANLYRNCLRSPRGGGGIFEDDFDWYDRKGHTTFIDKLSVNKERFFDWAGSIWLSRNCLYALSHLELIPQKAARKKYKSFLSKNAKFAADRGD
jgi:hypothetical protein